MEAAEAAYKSYRGFRVAEEDRNPGDTEVSLQTIAVRLPETPLLVNGSPYDFEVNDERLCQALNTVRNTPWRPGQFEPLFLKVNLGESLPAKIAGVGESKQPKIYGHKNNILDLELPAEVSKSNMPEKLLARQLEGVLNQDLARGIAQIRQEKIVVGHRVFLYKGGLAIAGMMGEGVGITTGSNSLEAALARGTGGALAAGIIMTGAVVAKISYTDRRLGKRMGLTTTEYKAQRRLERSGMGEDLEALFEEPIIKLVPSQPTPETT